MNHRQRIIQDITKWGKRDYNPYDLSPRSRTAGPATNYQVKLLIDIVSQLSDSEIKNIENELTDLGKASSYYTFLDYFKRIKELALVKKQKEQTKNITSGGVEEYNEIIREVKKAIDPVIKEGEKQIKERLEKARSKYREEYLTLDKEKFNEKYGRERRVLYGRGDVRTKKRIDWGSFPFNIVQKGDEDFIKYVNDLLKEYRAREENKVDKLFGKIASRWPNLKDFKFLNTSKGPKGIELTIGATNNKGEAYEIITETIYAGGYNIQVLHLRWIVHIKKDNQKVSTFKVK